jgi:uncharacterized protein (TIGR02246 family)
MKPMILLPLAVGLLIGADARADDAQEVEKAVRRLNEAFRDRNAEVINRLMTDNHLSITPYGGVQNKADQLRTLPDLKLTEYVTGAVKVLPLGKEAALVTYPVTMKGTYKGKAVAPKSHVSSVWVRREGQWTELSYQETPLDER